MLTLGIDIGATHVRAAIIHDGLPRPLGVWTTPRSPDLGELFTQLRRNAGAGPLRAGIGFAGGLAGDGVVSAWPNRPEYVGSPFVETAARALGTDPACLDDCAAAAVGEHAVRAGPGQAGTTLYVGIGTGIGGGVVVSGRLHRGATGSAVALGHLPVAYAGALRCTCGGVGCLQAIASGRALDREARAVGVPEGRVASLAQQGDEAARLVIGRAVRPLAEGLSWAARLLDPDRLVLGGGVMEAGAALLDPLREELRGRRVGCAVEPTLLGAWSGAIGAALFAVPEEERRSLGERASTWPDALTAGSPRARRFTLVERSAM